MRLFSPFLIANLCACGLAPTAAIAVPITFEFTGAIETPISANLLNAGFSSDSVTGSFTYDTNQAEQIVGPEFSLYDVSSFSFSDNGGNNAANYSSGDVTVENEAFDQFGVFGSSFSITGGTTNATGYSIDSSLFSLIDGTGSVFSNTSLPTSLSLDDFDLARLAVQLIEDESTSVDRVRYNLTSLNRVDTDDSPASVPAPGTLVLLGVGLLGLRVAARHR